MRTTACPSLPIAGEGSITKMSVQALVIVNSENRPVVVRDRGGDRVGAEANSASSAATVTALFHLHSSLDIVEEKQANRDPFIGLLTQTEKHKIFGLASTTNTKILLMVSPQSIRDNEARLILKTVHSAYVEVTTGNPFYRFGEPIKSRYSFPDDKTPTFDHLKYFSSISN